MEPSILNSTKKVLGLDADYHVYDEEIIMHINSTLATLNQLGVGPDAGFMVDDATATWESFLGTDIRLNSVRSYVFLKVKQLFDPPATSYLVTAMKEQIEELEYRISITREIAVVQANTDGTYILSDADIVDNGDGTWTATYEDGNQ